MLIKIAFSMETDLLSKAAVWMFSSCGCLNADLGHN